MAFTVLTKKYAYATYRLPLTADGTAYLLCKPVIAAKMQEISRDVAAESGFDMHIAAGKMTHRMLAESVVGWAGLVDINGAGIPFSAEMLEEICQNDAEFAENQLARIRRIAREAKLEEEKN